MNPTLFCLEIKDDIIGLKITHIYIYIDYEVNDTVYPSLRLSRERDRMCLQALCIVYRPIDVCTVLTNIRPIKKTLHVYRIMLRPKLTGCVYR